MSVDFARGSKLTTTVNFDPSSFTHQHVFIRKTCAEHRKPTLRGQVCRFLHSQVRYACVSVQWWR